MATSPREIKRRIKSVKNIGQITKAMELVSAAKMRKAQALALASRPYSIMSFELMRGLIGKSEITNPLLHRVLPEDAALPKAKILCVLISSERGLAGAYNTNVLNQAIKVLKQEGKEKLDFISVGRKGSDFLRRTGQNIIASFETKDKGLTILDAKPIAEIATQDFLNFKYDKVIIIYTDFVSTLVQKPNIMQLLPVHSPEREATREDENPKKDEDVLIEPDPDAVLENLVYRVLEFAIYQTMVEAAASEHSARMVAMRNANEAAHDLMDDLTLTYNQARQAGITRELSEISAAKLAMES